MARFNNGFFTSDHSNIQILDKEVHVVSDIANGALSKAQTASDTAQAALSTSDTALSKVDAFGIRLDALEAAQGASDGAGVVGNAAALVGDGTGVVGDAAALVGNAAETIGDSDRIMLGCTIAAAVAVTVMVGFVVFCFYQGIKHGKEEERNSSPADQGVQKKNQELNEPFESDFPSSDLYIGSPIQHSFHQSQQMPI